MSNIFLKVDKDYFSFEGKQKLNAVEILTLAQFAEFHNNGKACFISNKTLADNFGVSEKTIQRAVNKLEEVGLITKETINTKGGRERIVKIVEPKDKKSVEAAAEDKKSLGDTAKDSETLAQGLFVCCPKDNESLAQGQIDSIKDKEKINLKDNLKEGAKCDAPLGSLYNPEIKSRDWFIERQQGVIWTKFQGLGKYNDRFYVVEDKIEEVRKALEENERLEIKKKKFEY